MKFMDFRPRAIATARGRRLARLAVVALLATGALVGVTNAEDAASSGTMAIANPASVACVQRGGRLEIVTGPSGGQAGYCHLKDGRVCEEWALFRDGRCVPPPRRKPAK